VADDATTKELDGEERPEKNGDWVHVHETFGAWLKAPGGVNDTPVRCPKVRVVQRGDGQASL
jgi:hypothetical protein